MNQEDPVFTRRVESIYQSMQRHIQDYSVGPPGKELRSRGTIRVVTEDMVRNHDPKIDLVVLFDQALQMITEDLSKGFDKPTCGVEMFNHQARDWFTMHLERLMTGQHEWCSRLKGETVMAVLIFKFAAVPSQKMEEYGLLPFVQIKLVQFSENGGEDDVGVKLESQNWTVHEHALNASPEKLTAFGRD